MNEKEQVYTHFVYVPFTGVGTSGGFRGDDWYQDRIRIFKQYTLPSLLQQTNRHFAIWFSFRPEEENNPLTADLLNYVKYKGMNYVATFEGLMYHDDKFSSGTKDKLKNIARLFRETYRNGIYTSLPSNIKEIFIDKNSTLSLRLHRALRTFRDEFNVEWVVMTRIDSDDMFHKDAIEVIKQNIKFEDRYAVGFKGGYIYNEDTKELAEYNPTTNPPFHTIVFPSHTFFAGILHHIHYRGFKSHEDIPRLFDLHVIPKRLYCVFTHNPKYHISTGFNHPFKGTEIPPNTQQKNNILAGFGIIDGFNR